VITINDYQHHRTFEISDPAACARLHRMRDSVDLMAAIADLMERDGSYDALAMAARYRKQVAYARRLSPKTNGVNRSVEARTR
jgi:hypothetical protein